ncbi:hypothetical protein C0J52_02311 [Blattella germanica]|nr:hypothetical protein C0J52_02311 [Blattella germanica]
MHSGVVMLIVICPNMNCKLKFLLDIVNCTVQYVLFSFLRLMMFIFNCTLFLCHHIIIVLM